MYTSHGHLTYCTNIHAGETWEDHFARLRENIPVIKQSVSPLEPFGIGLRLSNSASLELEKPERLEEFRNWLAQVGCYVFTMNGFPFGGFHHTRVKDAVHTPDWLSRERVDYTIRLARILAELLPDDVDGGISTSPLTYRFWHREADLPSVFLTATHHIMDVVAELIRIREVTGKLIHLDVEPEPDGLLGDGKAFLDWYVRHLLPTGVPYLQSRSGVEEHVATSIIREHVQLCYDICHFAVSYEDHASMIEHTRALGIKVGKIQISAALRSQMPADMQQRREVLQTFEKFNEPVYLHQVVARKSDQTLLHYPDMPQALEDGKNPQVNEWRAHYHVPLFIGQYDLLHSTQADIREVLDIQMHRLFTTHLEVETYTWEVLPTAMRLPLAESIVRELAWVLELLTTTPEHHYYNPSNE